MNLTDLIKNNYCHFDSYRAGFLYYELAVPNDPDPMSRDDYDHYQFTIPVDDVGNGTINKKEKAITLMRWIRKAHAAGELIKISRGLAVQLPTLVPVEEKPSDFLRLKWGTLKAWDFSNSPEALAAYQEYYDIEESKTVGLEVDTPRQKELICKMIDTVNGQVTIWWNDPNTQTREDAKEYIMNYGFNDKFKPR